MCHQSSVITVVIFLCCHHKNQNINKPERFLMDDLNLYKSFNDLLEENEGWILTKNEHGKIKIASCKDDESNIYEKSRDWIVVDVDQTRTDTLQLPKPELFKIANFFIRDLLNSEQQDGYFSFRNIPYVNVFICGTVVSLYVRNAKYYMIVDDGTSSIKCIISQKDLSILKQNEAADFLVEKERSSKILKAAAMTIASKNFVEHSVPEFSDLELGNIVKLIGPMVEYDGNRYIFTKKIVKEPKGTISHCINLENSIHFYTEMLN